MENVHSTSKQRNMKIWNEVAPRYHKRWASVIIGPFQSTKKLIDIVKIDKKINLMNAGKDMESNLIALNVERRKK